MKRFAALVAVALAGLAAAFTLTHSPRAANPKLFGNVGPGYTITLTDGNGAAVTSLSPGTYDIEVTDQSSLHNFDLAGPGGGSVKKTDITGTGTVTWTVTLTAGTWTFLCDAHPDSMIGTFTVASAGTTTSGTTTTATTATSTAATTTTVTSVATTVPPPTTSATPPPPAPGVRVAARCNVPQLRGKTLAAARRLLSRRHCALGSVRRAYSTRAKAGIIIGQKPSAGARRGRGARVSVTVSRGRRR